MTIAASGDYLGGAIWPPVLNWGNGSSGWRWSYVAVGIFCGVTMTAVLLLLRMRIGAARQRSHVDAPPPRIDLQMPINTLTALLCVASICCCVAMAMPQVHVVAYCGDLGYGVARGSEMLSLMLAFGIISRIGSGFLADKIGGIRTLLIGSVAQGSALAFYLFFDSLSSLYIISAMFGLFQGGIVPSYAIIVREMDAGERSGDPGRHRDFRLGLRHVVRWLGVRRDLRRYRFLRRGIPERAGVECDQRLDRAGAVDPGAVALRLPDG